MTDSTHQLKTRVLGEKQCNYSTGMSSFANNNFYDFWPFWNSLWMDSYFIKEIMIHSSCQIILASYAWSWVTSTLQAVYRIILDISRPKGFLQSWDQLDEGCYTFLGPCLRAFPFLPGPPHRIQMDGTWQAGKACWYDQGITVPQPVGLRRINTCSLPLLGTYLLT